MNNINLKGHITAKIDDSIIYNDKNSISDMSKYIALQAIGGMYGDTRDSSFNNEGVMDNLDTHKLYIVVQEVSGSVEGRGDDGISYDSSVVLHNSQESEDKTEPLNSWGYRSRVVPTNSSEKDIITGEGDGLRRAGTVNPSIIINGSFKASNFELNVEKLLLVKVDDRVFDSGESDFPEVDLSNDKFPYTIIATNYGFSGKIPADKSLRVTWTITS